MRWRIVSVRMLHRHANRTTGPHDLQMVEQEVRNESQGDACRRVQLDSSRVDLIRTVVHQPELLPNSQRRQLPAGDVADAVHEEPTRRGASRTERRDGEDLNRVACTSPLGAGQLLPRRRVVRKMELLEELPEVRAAWTHDPLSEQWKEPVGQVGPFPVRKAQEGLEAWEVDGPRQGSGSGSRFRRRAPAGRQERSTDSRGAARRRSGCPGIGRRPSPSSRESPLERGRNCQRSLSSLLRLIVSDSSMKVAATTDNSPTLATTAAMSASPTPSKRSSQNRRARGPASSSI